MKHSVVNIIGNAPSINLKSNQCVDGEILAIPSQSAGWYHLVRGGMAEVTLIGEEEKLVGLEIECVVVCVDGDMVRSNVSNVYMSTVSEEFDSKLTTLSK